MQVLFVFITLRLVFTYHYLIIESRFTGLWVYKTSLITLCMDVAEPVGSCVSPTIEFFSFLTFFHWQHVPYSHGFFGRLRYI